MRRLSILLTVAAAVLVLPTLALAGNQEVAQQIAVDLRESGQLEGYKIGVKFQDGTAWLRGRVTSHEQMNAALRVAFQAEGVERVVNNLTVSAAPAEEPKAEEPKAEPKKKAGLLSTPLRQVAAAMEPERRPTQSASPQGTLARPVSAKAAERLQTPKVEAMDEPQVASQVATTFEATPVQPTAAVAEPIEMPAQLTPVEQPMVIQDVATPPVPVAYTQQPAGATPQYAAPVAAGAVPVRFDQPNLPNYAWPSYAAHPNYAALTYPKQHSPCAWPYIGPYYPYPQVPMGWRKVTLQWHDGWWHLDFDDGSTRGPFSGLFRPHKIHR